MCTSKFRYDNHIVPQSGSLYVDMQGDNYIYIYINIIVMVLGKNITVIYISNIYGRHLSS